MSTAADSPMGGGLHFSGMTSLGILHGFDLQFSCTDKAAQLSLCVGEETNRVIVTGTTPLSRQADVLAAIDRFGKWGQAIPLWMVAEKNGVLIARTGKVDFESHVKPYCGALTISQIAGDNPAMVYPGNGDGRLLSRRINDRYYFIHGGALETEDAMRGFDCTSFPMALLGLRSIPKPGYGKHLSEAAGCTQCDLEQVKSADLAKRFRDDTIPVGLYVLFSAGHVLLYNSDCNTLYEFNYGGFKRTPAGLKHLKAPQELWWMRKLDERYRPAFN